MNRRAIFAVAMLGTSLLISSKLNAGVPPPARFDALISRIKSDMLKDPAAAAAEARRAEAIADGFSDDHSRSLAGATALWLQAEALSRIGDMTDAGRLIVKAETQLHRTPHPVQLAANVLLTAGSIHDAQTDVAEAFQDYQAAHRLFGRVGDKRKQAIALVMIANLYDHAHDYLTALHYTDEAFDTFPADPGLAQSMYNSRGIALRALGRFDAADRAMRIALQYARQLHSPRLQMTMLHNIAQERLLANRLAAADAAITVARSLPDDDDNDRRQLDVVRAQAAFRHRNLDEAQMLINRAFIGIDLTRTDVSWRDPHEAAVAIYTAQHRPDLALAHLQALKRLDDDATKLATQASTALMAARFDSANQEAKIRQLRDAERLRVAQEALQRAKTERTLWLGGAGATAIVILILLGSLRSTRRSRDRVRAVAADLAVTNEALGKALTAKTEFLATTSHEIRTPLNGILGMAQVMLADTALPASARERLGVLQTAGLTMRTLVDDILDMAKVETGHLTLEQAPFDLPAVLDGAARMWADQAKEKGVALLTDLAACPPRVVGDAARVRQIAGNLLSNALKFTASGSVTLAAVPTVDGVAVSVTDTGIGIAPDKLELIFESFRQADTTTTRRFGGTGLGLAICRSLARAMGGEVRVASRVGEGSTFTAHLPLPPAAAPVVTSVAGAVDTVLIVDRNPITRAMLRAVVAPRAGAVAVAGTAAEALVRLGQGGVTRVLIDDATARAEGDAAGFIATVQAAAASATVFLLWPSADAAAADKLCRSGTVRLIGKPIAGPTLVAALFDHADRVEPLVSEAA